jgi:HEAT repeat protein
VPLQTRWSWALAEANRHGLSDFWIAYSFSTPTHAEHVMMSDSHDGSMVIHDGKVFSKGPALVDVLDDVAPDGAPGPVVVALKYASGRSDSAISRAAYRSASVGFDFGRRPVFWLGHATETDSFGRLEQLTSQVREEKLRILFIEAASLHPTTDLVLPFLVRLLEPSNPVAIRREAAEGFDHHHDPRSVEILLRTARQDPAEEVRTEAAETIGEVQTSESIPALKELALGSPDSAVRREAAEAFSDQPADLAIPAIEAVIAKSDDDGTLEEAVEALGEIGGQRAMDELLEVAWKHPKEQARREAVETLASIEGDASLAALVRIAWEHPDVAMQVEAVESIGDKSGASAAKELERIIRDHPREDVQAEAVETIGDVTDGLNETIVQIVRSGKNARVRREAIDALSHTAEATKDAGQLDRIEQVLEAAIFEDSDHSVRIEAMDAVEQLPATRAKRVLRKVIERHPDAQMREEATDLEQDRNH